MDSGTSRSVGLALLLGLGGCSSGIINDSEMITFGTFGTGEIETSMVDTNGTFWCARLLKHPDAIPMVTGPRECDGVGSADPWNCVGTLGIVTMDEPDGTNPWACVCATTEQHQYFLEDAIIGDDEDVEDAPMLFEFQAAAIQAAEKICIELLDEDTDINECELVMPANLAETPPIIPTLFQEGQPGDCVAGTVLDGETTGDPPPGVAPMPPDNWSDYYSLHTVIEWNSTHSRYDVDAEFYEDLIASPAWLLNDEARLVETSPGIWTLDNVDSGTILNALGLQDGDRIMKVDNTWVTTPLSAMEAFRDLQGGTTFVVRVRRGGVDININYSVR